MKIRDVKAIPLFVPLPTAVRAPNTARQYLERDFRAMTIKIG